MDSAPRSSRRAILRSGLLAAGAVAGVLGITGITDRLRGGSLVPSDRTDTNIKLYGTGFSLAAPGLRPGDLPKRGDRVSISGALAQTPGGEPIGSFFSTVQHLDGAAAHGPFAIALMETHTFLLPDGTLVGIGSTVPGTSTAFAIVGGTGGYQGATGSYTASQNPFETGGDGTAEFTLTLKAGR